MLALTAYCIRCKIQLRLFKNIFISKDYYRNELLSLIRGLQELQETFERNFSFMPFLWLGYNWCQATIYFVGLFLGHVNIPFCISVITWSLYQQVVLFATIGVTILVSQRLSYQCIKVQVILEDKSNGSILDSNAGTYLLGRLKEFYSTRFSAWRIFFLDPSIIFSYLASLISFSVLMLQVDQSRAQIKSSEPNSTSLPNYSS